MLQNLSRFFIPLAACSIVAGLTMGCDLDEDPPVDFASTQAVAEVPTRADLEALPVWSSPPQLDAPLLDPGLANETIPFPVEIFRFTEEDFIALTSAPGGLFQPTPAGIPLLDEPAITTGFFVAMKLHDVDGETVGFGSEQEVLDLANETALTTYTLTIPGRGTLMLRHEEDLSFLLDEVNDMLAKQEYVRVFDPPLVVVNTIPGTGKVVGGSKEFKNAKGVWREIGIMNEINLLEGSFDLGIELQILTN